LVDIIITETMNQESVDDLVSDFDVHYDPDLVNKPDELIAMIPGVPGLIVRNLTQVRRDLIEAGDGLLAVGRLGVGLDNIDMEACAENNIQVFPAVGANTDSVVELIVGALFVLFRGAYHSSNDVLSGKWPKFELKSKGQEVRGKCLGIIGFGNIGKETSITAKAIGMQVIASDPFIEADDPVWEKYGVRKVSQQELIAMSDAITVHVPLIDGTRPVIGVDEIESMKPGVMILNAARGGVVNEAALIEGLNSGKIGGALVDVFVEEPMKPGSAFEGVPNVILTPHVGAMTIEADIRVSQMTANNVRRVLEGKK